MTYSDYITDALRLINVLMENESASADQGETALRMLNEMLALWESNGVDLGYVPSTTLTDNLTLPMWSREAVKAQLAIRLCPMYERQPSPVVLEMARVGKDTLDRIFMVAEMAPVDLRHVPQRRRGYNILTDR